MDIISSFICCISLTFNFLLSKAQLHNRIGVITKLNDNLKDIKIVKNNQKWLYDNYIMQMFSLYNRKKI